MMRDERHVTFQVVRLCFETGSTSNTGVYVPSPDERRDCPTVCRSFDIAFVTVGSKRLSIYRPPPP